MLNILKQLENIKSQLHRFQKIHPVDKDLLLEKIRDLYMAVIVMDQQAPVAAREETFELEPEIEGKQQKAEVKHEVKAAKQKSKSPEGKQSEPTIIAEQFQGEKTFMNEHLAQMTSTEDLSTVLQSKPIDDLASAIGINDKYKLIRELFNGNTEVYNQAIEKLNSATNFNEAFTYISSTFGWELEDEPVQFLLDLVRRKFITDKNG